MERADLQEAAEYLIDIYRDVLNVDPYFQIKVEIGEGDFVSSCKEDEKPASWILKLNPERHTDVMDIQFSVVDSLVRVLFRHIESGVHSNELISKLTTSFVQLLPDGSDESEDDDYEEQYEEDE